MRGSPGGKAKEPKPIYERKYIGLIEAAEFLGLSPKYCYNLVCLGKIPYYKPAGRLYFLRADLEEYIRRGRHAADYELRDMADKILNARKA